MRLLIPALLALPALASAQGSSIASQAPERAIRRSIPITNAIRRAYERSTRDSTGKPGRNYWQLRTDYTIQARLDPTTQTITGQETIRLHNESPDTLTEIRLRLDHNIYRPTTPQGLSTPAETTEGMVVTKLTVNGEDVDLNAPPPSGRGGGGQQPTRLRASDMHLTLARITLASPIAPRSAATLAINWRTKLPGGPGGSGHRMTQRWADTLFQPTQWYPRIAKYDDLRGWDTNIYLGPSEFYNNFGRFDVRITVPGGWIVSGTGVLQNPNEVLTATARERLSQALRSDSVTTIVGPNEVGPGMATAAGDWLTWHLVADQVNDFAWATAKKFVWTATRATIPTKGPSPVPIHMVYLPGRADLYRDAGWIARHAIEFYSRLYAPYPFPQLTLQDGPSSGMEYPMVINSNRGAADHEAAHQWWPMMVGNNETWYGWMDEGFNQYMNILSEADSIGRPPVLNSLGQSYGATSGDEWEPPMMWNANWAGPRYGFQTYQKTPLMLSMLGGIVGDSAVWRAQSAFTKAWAFKHPSPWDFMFFMSNQFQQDLGWFWYYWLFTTERVDGSIKSVQTAGGKTTVTIHQAGEMPSPVVLRVEFETDGPTLNMMPNATVERNHAAIVTWPVNVWFNGSRTFTAVLDFGGRGIRRITLDPFGRFPDKDVSDNVWPR